MTTDSNQSARRTYLTPRMVADALSVSVRTVTRLAARDGRVADYRAVRVGDSWRFVEQPAVVAAPVEQPAPRQKPEQRIVRRMVIGPLPADYVPVYGEVRR